MAESATSSSKAVGLDALIETDSKILEQVQKDLSQEYIRFMSRVMKERLGMRPGGAASVFEHLRKGASSPPESKATS
jgi:hypothetical protein